MSSKKLISFFLFFLSFFLNTIHVFATDSLPKKLQKEVSNWPKILQEALEEEENLKQEGYLVAYQNIPDTTFNDAIIIYIFNAVVAELIYGSSPAILPRSIFDSPYYDQEITKLLSGAGDDHAEQWRAVGISCSPTLFSRSECEPIRNFEQGYAALSTDGTCIIMTSLEKLAFNDAKLLAEEIRSFGADLFRGLKGAILQIAVHKKLAPRFMRLTLPFGKSAQSSRDSMSNYKESFLLKDKNRNRWQTRLICDPCLLMSESCKMNFYHSNETQFFEYYQLMKTFILEKLNNQWNENWQNENIRMQIKQNLRDRNRTFQKK